MRATPFTTNFLLMLAGPLIWAAHFLAVYVYAGILCARPRWNVEWLGLSIAGWGTVAASVVALAAMAALLVFARARGVEHDNRIFIRWISIGLSLLSAVAIIWETVPVFLVPACG